MCTTALPQIAFSLTKWPPFFPDTAPVMRGVLSDCLYLACEIFKSSCSWWKPPPSLLDPSVMFCIAHPNRTNKIRDTGVEVRCAGSTSHLQSARCMLPRHWSRAATFSQVLFHPGPSSEPTQNIVVWVTWIADSPLIFMLLWDNAVLHNQTG